MEGKKNVALGVLITLLLCVIGFCIYLIVDKGNSVKEEEKQTNTEEKKENEIVNSDEEKQKVIDKLNMVFAINDFSLNNKLHSELSAVNHLDTFADLANGNGLTDDLKLKIALQYVNDKTMVPSEDIYAIKVLNVNVIKKDDLVSAYKLLFNEELSQFVDQSFAGYSYKNNNGEYEVYSTYLGGAGYGAKEAYINNITFDKDTVYVHVNFASANSKYINEEAKSKCFIVDGITDEINNPIYTGRDESVNGTWVNDCNDYKIDETNYQKFTNYKFAFKKNNEEEYYLASIEKAN